jgi:enoyl-CoA hydratase/carnithine racemase
MVLYEVTPPRATITIDDPDRRNPLSVAVMGELHRHTLAALADPEVKVLVYTGAGDRAFSAGGDLQAGFADDPIGLHQARGSLARLVRAMWGGGKPTVARVNGHALAGGFGLACACDIVICVADAKLGTPEIDLGLWPMMISAVLIRTMPRKAALELMMTGRLIDPIEALHLGAVSRVVDRAELDGAVDQTVAALAAKSTLALAMGRDSFYAMADLGTDAALDRLQGGLTAITLTEDAAEGLRAFNEKRPPRWQGR